MMTRVVTAALLALIAAAPAPAQSTDAGEERTECERARGLERRRCEDEADANGTAPAVLPDVGRPAESEEFRLSLSRLGEDLRFLLAAPRHLANAASHDGELDCKAVAKSAAEIGKRAARLKESLALPDAGEVAARRRATVLLESGHLRAALSELAAMISEALRNPVLRGYLIDAEESAEARNALDGIVELSARIKLSSEMLCQDRRSP